MVLFPDTAAQLLRAGGGLRVSTKGLMLDTMVRYASAAAAGQTQITFVVGDGAVFPDTMIQVAAAGRGHVIFDVT